MSDDKNIGIDDIAKMANVSKTAVSFALNNKPGISDETRKKILDIVEKLNFKHKKKELPKSPSCGKIGFVKFAKHGHIVNRDHDAFISDYIFGINQECKNKSFEFSILDIAHGSVDSVISMDVKGFDGLIILGTELNEADVRAIHQLNVPIVFLDTYFNYLPYNFVTMNNNDAVYSIIDFLKKSNISDIQMVTSDLECANFRERENAFLESMKALDLTPSSQPLLKLDSTFLGSYEGMKSMLDDRKKLPQALLCANDIIALGCIKALKEYGIKIPGDISITGFDDLPGSSMTDPALTTYQVPKEYIGKVGFRILADKIKEKMNGCTSVKLRIDGKLVKRESTAI